MGEDVSVTELFPLLPFPFASVLCNAALYLCHRTAIGSDVNGSTNLRVIACHNDLELFAIAAVSGLAARTVAVQARTKTRLRSANP